jgi:hypothetical protein
MSVASFRVFVKSLIYGLLMWVALFVSAIFIFPLKTGNPALFETFMSILLCLFTTIASIKYFKKTELSFKNAIAVGFIWLAVNMIIDLPLFSFGPMKRTLPDYFSDIGLTYFIIPIITAGMAMAAKKYQTAKVQELSKN